MGAAVGAAERIVGLLADAGVRRLYGWAGEGSCLDLIEAARARDIPLVAPRLLASAAIMAATEGDLLGRPGVCVAPRAAWAAVPGLAHANAGHSPLLFLFSGQPRGVHAESDERFERALRAVAKAGTEITGSRVERALLWAWRKSNQYPQGPVYLGIGPRACARFSEDDAPLTFRVPIKPSPSGIRRIARVLAGAGRAVLVAGTGCRTPRAAAALVDCAEHLGAPVFTTRRAKGAFPEDHALSAGVFFGSRWEHSVLARADCALTVGLDAAGLIPGPWPDPLTVLSIQEYPGRSPYRARAEAWGDIATALIRLRQELPPAGEWRLADWAPGAARLKDRIRALHSGRGARPAPHRVVAAARSLCPKDTIACVDSGAHATAVAAFWEAYDPQGYVAPMEGGTGSALPAAIAAKLALPERPVVAFLSEGGLFASSWELATASNLGLPILAIVFLDEAFCSVQALQEGRHFAPVGVTAGPARLAALAEQLGAFAIEVDTEADLRQAIGDALGAPRPAVIGVRIDPTEYRQVLETLADASVRR